MFKAHRKRQALQREAGVQLQSLKMHKQKYVAPHNPFEVLKPQTPPASSEPLTWPGALSGSSDGDSAASAILIVAGLWSHDRIVEES